MIGQPRAEDQARLMLLLWDIHREGHRVDRTPGRRVAVPRGQVRDFPVQLRQRIEEADHPGAVQVHRKLSSAERLLAVRRLGRADLVLADQVDEELERRDAFLAVKRDFGQVLVQQAAAHAHSTEYHCHSTRNGHPPKQ